MADLEAQIANLSPAKRALLARRREQNAAAPLIRRRQSNEDAPLSSAQQRLWLTHELDPGSYLYNVPRFLKLTGTLDIAALEASLNEIVRRHEILRTTFHSMSGQPIQTIGPELVIRVHVTDLRETVRQDKDDLALELALAEYRRTFDLAHGPLIRVNLWQTGEEQYYLLLVMHHIVSDGWTGGILFEELGAHYRAFAVGALAALPPLPFQYADFATWQSERMEDVLEKHLSYWREKLAGAPASLSLPTDHPRSEDAGFRAHVCSLLLSPSLSQKLPAFAQEHGMTLFPILLTALKALLSRWTGKRDLVVGTISANRNSTEVEKLIGCFMNFLALRDHIDEAETALSLMRKVNQTVLEAFSHQDCPFEKIVEELNPQRSLNANPLYNVALQLQNYPEFAFRGDGLEARFLPFETRAAFLDLRLLVTETQSGVLLECECSADLFESSTCDLLLAGYRDTLQQIIANPDQEIAELQVPDALAMHAEARCISQNLVAIAATFTADPIQESVDFWMKQLDISATIRFAPYGQIFQQLLDPSSLMAANPSGANVILLRMEDLHPFETAGTEGTAASPESSVKEFVAVVHAAVQRSAVPYIICAGPPSTKVHSNPQWRLQCQQAEALLTAAFSETSAVQFVASSKLLELYPVSGYDDEHAWKIGRIPYTRGLFAALGTLIARLIYKTRAVPRQVIVLRYDGTLWDGTSPEQRTSGAVINRQCMDLQEFVIAQQEAGRILCLSSTHLEEEVVAALENNAAMALGWQHFTASRFGQTIVAGLPGLAQELGLPLDSFIYVDADLVTCAEVRDHYPEALVVELPSKGLGRFLKNLWPFDSLYLESSATLRPSASQSAHIASCLSTVPQLLQAIETDKMPQAKKEGDYIAPRSPLEELLGDIWASLLNVSSPGVHDNFFALGGHSLLAVQLLARVRQALGVGLPLRAVFSAPTIAGLAKLIEAARNEENVQPVLSRRKVSHEGNLPLSFAQQRLWFIDQLEPGNPLYNIPQMYRMHGSLNRDALENSLNEIVRRHESLRTAFHSVDGQPVQVVAPYLRIPLGVVVVTGVAPEEREAEVERIAKEGALQPFDLAKGPLLRATLLMVSEKEYVLLLTLHHIVGDGWSGNLLAQELVTLYDSFSRDMPSPLSELAFQYADFALSQREWLQGEMLDRQVRYWKQQLEGAPPLLELPTDHARPAILRHRGALQEYVLPAELLAKLKAMSQIEGVTLFMTLFAGFQLLLSHYSRQEDIVVGSPVAGRNHIEIEPLIGFFVNTLALRTNLAEITTFRELLNHVKQTVLDAFAHQEIPFERLVEELRPERTLSFNPIFQVLFSLQKSAKLAFDLPELRIERRSVHQATSVFDLSWFAFETADGIVLRVEYDTDLFDAATIGRSLKHYENLLEDVTAYPEKNLPDIALLGTDEIHRVLVEFNNTTVDYPKCSIQDLLAKQFDLAPDAVALIDGDTRVTYKELDRLSNQIAHYLLKRGAGPDVPIAIYCERSTNLVAGILGILKAGSAYVPLDPTYPRERVKCILEDSRAHLVLTQESISNDLSNFAAELIYLDTDRPAIDHESVEAPITGTSSKNLAYILFTSGSTGRPKGVALEHRTPVTFIQWCRDTFTPKELSGVLFATSVCFDVSVFEIFVTLSAGGKVVLAQNALHLPDLAARDEVTLINTVPSVMAELVRSGGVPDSVKTVNLAGEPLTDALLEEIYASTKVERVYNLYGPTETSYSTYTLAARGCPITIGRPIANTQCYILDSHLHPAPIGVPGELYIAGDGEARGYYGRPDLTKERFIPNPFAGGRMYHTGDVCRWLPDGNIQYFGRVDQQVKIHGFRIELGEIEAVLDRHPNVLQSIVMVREDEPGLKGLVAYVIPGPDATIQPEDLRAHIKLNLPEFMVPAAVVLMDSFPLTPNGKVDRKGFPAPANQQQESGAYAAPRTPTEEVLVGIWAEVLRLPHVGAHDDFFLLGGHSLLATQVISRVRRAFAVDLPVRTIFESSDLSSFAARVEKVKRAQHRLDLPPLVTVPHDQPLPLSFAQQRMWFIDQLEPDNPLFNIPCTLRVESALDVPVLQQAIDALVERHETLRTNFQALDGKPIQLIAGTPQVTVQVIDLRGLPNHEGEQEALRIVSALAQRPFKLSSDPLLRVMVVRLSDSESILSLVIHHIIGDRWSITVLLRELFSFYTAFSEGKGSPLPSLPIQYADFAVWQRRISDGERFQKDLAYWVDQLKDAPPLVDLPTDRARQPVPSTQGESVTVLLSQQLTEKLNALARSSGTTLYMVLVAGFQVLLSRYSGQDDIIVGMPIACRNHPEIEGLIGLFANTLPLRLKLTGSPDFLEVLRRTKDAALDAYGHQDMPFDRLVEELNPERNLSYDPLVQVYFILQNAPHEGLSLNGLDMKHIETNTKTSKGDLYLSLTEQSGGLYGRLEYNTDLFNKDRIERMLGHYQTLLEAAAADPSVSLKKLPLLTTGEYRQIVFDWNRTELSYPSHKCIHELFEEQVARTPNAVAVVFEDEELSYAELNRRANQLAHYLIDLGVRPDARVAICAERSFEMVIALLAVLKSGGAYVPLDPDYPVERLRFMVDDCAPTVLLTQKHLAGLFSGMRESLPVLDLAAANPEWRRQPDTNADPNAIALNPQHLAYMIYTSGSTGQPKGVMMHHRGVVNRLVWMQHAYALNPCEAVLQKTPFGFDVSVWEFFWTLLNGARLVMARPEGHKDPGYLIATIVRNNITTMHFVPSMLQAFLEHANGAEIPSLVRVVCSGEALSAALLRRFQEQLPNAVLHNLYGPTEAAVDVTAWTCPSGFNWSNVPIGKPVANTQMYILDKNSAPVPIGVSGELYIGGVQVARGYLNRPELTAERFVDDPFTTEPGARMYRTGDLGRWLADGNIEYQGRNDFQVKLRGYRIELGEIETVLGNHPSVQECAVLAREDVVGDKRLVGYVVLAPGTIFDPADLRLWIKSRLPEYMVPAAWVQMEQFPLSPSGKLDRKNLPAPEHMRPELSSAFEQAHTPTEELIASICAEVLQLDKVGLHDDFFELGGHSLLATQVVSRIRHALQVELPLRSLFEAPNVAGLAERAEAARRQMQGVTTPPLRRVARNQPLPLSFAQQRLWFVDQLEPNNPLYNVSYITRMQGCLQPAILEKSLQEIVRRHETLRTTFQTVNDEPVQVVAPHLDVPLLLTDLTAFPVTERLDVARKLATEEVKKPFNLQTGPLLRATLFKLDEQDHALVVSTHHIIIDHWSLGILSQELGALYEAFAANQPSPLTELPIQYADYAVWQREFMAGDTLEQQLDYWRRQLQGAPPVLELPTDRPRQATEGFWGSVHNQPLPEDLVQNLRSFSRKNSVTFFMTLLAGFQMSLVRYTNEDDIVVGTDLANRTQLDTEWLIGCFVNILPIRCRFDGDPSFQQVLVRVRETSLGAYAHQELPFDKLVEELHPERSLTHHPLVQVLFVMQNMLQMIKEFGGLKLGPLGVSSSSRFELVLFVNDPDGSPYITWMYNPNLFDASTIERMAFLYESLLRSAIADPQIKLAALYKLLDEEERKQREAKQSEFQEASLRRLKQTRRRTTVQT